MEGWWNDTASRTLKCWEDNCPSVLLSTRNRTWTGLGLNLGVHDIKLVTRHINYGLARRYLKLYKSEGNEIFFCINYPPFCLRRQETHF